MTDNGDPTANRQPGLAPWTETRDKSGWGGLVLDPTSTLFVSLFLMLFAFFAVMNANSVEKPREAVEVMDSLQEIFGRAAVSASEFDASLDPTVVLEPDSDAGLLAVHETFAAEFPEADIRVAPNGKNFEVSLSANSFFVEDTLRLAPSRELFLKSLAEASSGAAVEPLMIEIIFSAEVADVDQQRSVAALAATLGKYGVLPGNLAAIGTEGEIEQIRFGVSRR